MVFFCKKCKQKLALNFNPFAVWSSATCILALVTVVTGILQYIGCMTNIRNQCTPIYWLVILCASIFPLKILYTLICFFITKFFLSNFVPTSETDNLVYPLPDLVMDCHIKLRYFHESNVFQTVCEYEIFHIYLIKKGKKSKFHICGIDGEPELLLALIRQKQERGEKVTLPLTFEGKFVGNAEVLETYDPPQFSNEER